MSELVIAFGAVTALISAIVSSWLVYKATTRSQELTRQAQAFEQRHANDASLRAENDRLRDDIVELDNQRRAYYAQNVHLLKHIERLRAWAYALMRLLTLNGISDIPPEPEEAPE